MSPVLSTHSEVSADCQDGLNHQDAAHVDVERKREYFAPNPFVMEKSAEIHFIVEA